MSARLALLVGAALVCGGCEVPSDIGKPCVLVKKPAAGSSAKYETVALADIQFDQDFISFGSQDCDELICVRNAYAPIETTGEGEQQLVLGYCSKACVPDTAASLQPTCSVNHPEASAEVESKMTCRPLLLDQKALDDFRSKDPVGYRNTFGDNASPYFCASSNDAPVSTP